MNKLNQLGTLVMIFLAFACQASSSENRVSKTDDTTVEELTSPTTTTSEAEFNAEGEIVAEVPPSTTPEQEDTPAKDPQNAAAKTVAFQPKEEVQTKERQPSPEEETSTPPAKATEVTQSEVVNEEAPSAEAIVASDEEVVVETPVVEVPAPPSHKAWNNLLTQYVSRAGNVQYKSLKESRMKEIEQYLKELADNPVQKSWTKAQKMAYWMNAYNAFTVKLILDNYPITSITKLSGGKVWDKKWIKLGDKTYSLNNIENDILRPMYKDARIHFAVNCAAKSCPPLLNRAWTDVNLEYYLEGQAKRFINHPDYNQISADKVVISKIFEWYAEDFGNIIEYLNKYSKTKINPDAKVSYQEYDWALNQ